MNETKIITNFEQTVFSIARHSAGCTIEGKHFCAVYPRRGEESKIKSALIRQDLMRKFTKLRKTKSFDEILS